MATRKRLSRHRRSTRSVMKKVNGKKVGGCGCNQTGGSNTLELPPQTVIPLNTTGGMANPIDARANPVGLQNGGKRRRKTQKKVHFSSKKY